MLFTSTVFLFIFLPSVLLVNFLLPKDLRNVFLLISSLFFYAWGEVYYAVILLFSITFNFLLARALAQSSPGAKKRALLIFTVVVNLAILAWFKYADFIVDNINAVLAVVNVPTIKGVASLHLPLGISFFTFQALSYVMDVYKGKVPVQKRFVNLALYISLFPQLILGPIIRYRDMAGEIIDRTVNSENFAYGIRRFIIGMGKKIILANSLGEVADVIFTSSPLDLTAPVAWLGIVCYTLQIYFDFSGYSDMAIGLGRMLGFKFLENFNYPYISQSIREFWRRWHISLSTWSRDYLYIPLGGNRYSLLRTQLNIWIVFFLYGLWHGTGWNFILWGAVHGLFLSLERMGLDRVLQHFWRPLRHLYLVLVVMSAFVLFRTETISEALSYFSAMLGLAGGNPCSAVISRVFTNEKQILLVIGIAATLPWRSISSVTKERLHSAFPDFASGLQKSESWLTVSVRTAHLVLLFLLFFTCLAYIAPGNNNSAFIYFRF